MLKNIKIYFLLLLCKISSCPKTPITFTLSYDNKSRASWSKNTFAFQ